ncbi:MAG: 2-oxoacid:acceptor oxidoreductase family protein, partial [Verrucomicrobiota bacterium]
MVEQTTLEAKGFYDTFPRKGGSAPRSTHYCPGCGHGILHKLIAEALAELEIQDRTVLLSPVGCSVFAYYYLDCGNIQAAHGRAPAVGTAVKRACKDAVVISYQGDGDLCSIGFNEVFHAANRGEGMVVFFMNNSVYGMTGGQMAPTTLLGQKTTTSPYGKSAANDGYPIGVCEIMNQLPAPVYLERCSLADGKRIMSARRAVRKALRIQKQNKGFALVELLSPCPTNTKKTPLEAAAYVTETMEKTYPLGCFRDHEEEAVERGAPERVFEKEKLDRLYDSENTVKADVKFDPGYKTRGIKVAGFGGQGVLSLGLFLARTGQYAGRHVTWYPSYGPEQRGGTANCSVVVSGSEIGSPVVSLPDVLIAMNQPSLDKFAATVPSGGMIFSDSDIKAPELPDAVRLFQIPAFKIASEKGMPRAANTAMIGA